MRKFLLAILFVLLLVSCAVSRGEGEGIYVYFLPPIDASDSSPVAVRTDMGDGGILQGAANALLNGTEEYPSPYDTNVRLVSIECIDSITEVVFGGEYENMPPDRRAAADACLVLTLCEIDGVAAVRINGGDIISAADILYAGISLEPLAREITLYFADSSGSAYVIGEKRNVLLRESIAMDSFVIEELLKGPNAGSLESALPKGTRLVGIAREDGVCHVNFSEEYRELSHRPFDEELRAIRAVAATLCALDGVTSVQILCEGERLYSGAIMDIASQYGIASRVVYLAARDGLERTTLSVADFSELAIIEALIGGADGHGFMSPLPTDMQVLSIRQSEGIFYIDFSRELSDNGDIQLEEQACRAVALTLASNLEHVGIVNIEVRGVPYAVLTFPE